MAPKYGTPYFRETPTWANPRNLVINVCTGSDTGMERVKRPLPPERMSAEIRSVGKGLICPIGIEPEVVERCPASVVEFCALLRAVRASGAVRGHVAEGERCPSETSTVPQQRLARLYDL